MIVRGWVGFRFSLETEFQEGRRVFSQNALSVHGYSRHLNRKCNPSTKWIQPIVENVSSECTFTIWSRKISFVEASCFVLKLTNNVKIQISTLCKENFWVYTVPQISPISWKMILTKDTPSGLIPMVITPTSAPPWHPLQASYPLWLQGGLCSVSVTDSYRHSSQDGVSQ